MLMIFPPTVVLLSILYRYKVQSTTIGLILKVYVPVTIIVRVLYYLHSLIYQAYYNHNNNNIYSNNVCK